MDNFNWIQEEDGGIRVLCFDNYYGGDSVDSCWTVSVPEGDLAAFWDEMDTGYRARGNAGITQDLLAMYDSEHFDAGTVGFDMLQGEVRRGEWIPETEWIESNYRRR